MIKIEEQKIISAAEEGMDAFLKVFTDAYLEALDGEMTADNMHLLNGYQHTLLAYRYFCDELNIGGFVQLIHNGYGGYIFDNPTAKALRQMGARGISKLIYKAKEIFDEHRDELETHAEDEAEFMARYEQYEQFDPIEEKFMEIEEEETAIIAHYVDEHIEDFAEIIQ